MTGRALGPARVAAVYALVASLVLFSRPTVPGLAAGLALVAAGEAIRLWAAGHLVKTRRLVTSGPYRHVRNPLYLGRLLIFVGLCLAAWLPRGLTLAVLPAGLAVFFGYYLPRKERVEPERLRGRHGAAYEAYRAAVPSLVPALRPYPAAAARRWSARLALRNREHWMVAGLTLVAWILVRRL